MSVNIGEAYCDENGKAKGGEPGDQTGKELRIRAWYKRSAGWDAALVCQDKNLAGRAAGICRRIIESRRYGYDQSQRWTAYENIKAAGGDIETAELGECDCSSLVIMSYIFAGLNIKPEGYTGNIRSILKKTGLFTEHTDTSWLTSGDKAPAGTVYVGRSNGSGHTLLVLENDSAPDEEDEDPDVTDSYIVVAKESYKVRVRNTPVAGKTILLLRYGTKLPVIGVDDASGWYKVSTTKGDGYITNNTKYVKLVGNDDI